DDPAALDAYFAALRDRVFGGDGQLGAHLGLQVLEVSRDRVVMRMPWRPELRRWGDIFHGGALMALADQVGGCLFNVDPRVVASGSTALTTDFNMSFLRAAAPGEAVVATGSVLRRGRNMTFMVVDVNAESSRRLVATCRASYLTVAGAQVGK
ncbi:MAG: PaaI family thioesterase, partial [Myxococcota bacterium]|nr:PaaI family thioesterase [Myxococcota bacterium]